MSKRATVLVAISFAAGLLMSPVAVSATQKIFDPTAEVVTDLDFMRHKVYRFDDPDLQVKCWLSQGNRAGGISCLPWHQVKER